MNKRKKKCRGALAFALAFCLGSSSWAGTSAGSKKETPEPSASAGQQKPSLDRSGKPRKGKASFYGKKFHGKKMADGTPMDPNANIAASKTLPLGSKARVTNLENGKSEVVEIRDRGPYISGRIVDVSPKVAERKTAWGPSRSGRSNCRKRNAWQDRLLRRMRLCAVRDSNSGRDDPYD